MTKTTVEALAEFTFETDFERLPAAVVEESKRLLVDSIGCALGGLSHPKGVIGTKFAELQGPGAPGEQSTVLGTGARVSAIAAAFANGELINALDFDAILPPGHVSPYVIPCALAAAEAAGASGKDLLSAVAIAHEMSNRIGKALDYLRDTKDGKPTPPPVFGYSSTVFGAAAAVGKLRGHALATLVSDLGIAGAMSPVNTQWSWSVHTPTATVKYGLAGAVTQAAMAATYLAELGHTGDIQVLDDGEHGYRRQIGSARWQPERITPELGSKWYFPSEVSYKPYPHCRVMHAPLDVLIDIVEKNNIQPAEIESIRAWVEGWVMKPLWTNRKVEHVTQAQFSMAHVLALGAHRIPVGKRWQAPEVVFDPSVIALMDKVHYEVHPDYVERLTGDAASRPARIEVVARGQTFVGETLYPKGSLSPDPSTRMSNDEISAKFVRNAEGVISSQAIDRALEKLWNLEQLADFSTLVPTLCARS
ncbi:MAG: MmgE/PrpD family protein [Burkholderiaceae bacterium]|nr:MmgE/PrpD family protein [Burkholderiaceae bacterium]